MFKGENDKFSDGLYTLPYWTAELMHKIYRRNGALTACLGKEVSAPKKL